MAKDKGFVWIYRNIYDNWIWKSDEPFDKRAAFIDLILMVNHDNAKINIKGNSITVQRGQHFTSINKLADRWKWSANKVRRYLNRLVYDGMVHIDGRADGTLITLVNYGVYQDGRRANGRANGRADERAGEPTGGRAGGTQTSNELSNEEVMNKGMNKKSASQLGGDRVWQ